MLRDRGRERAALDREPRKRPPRAPGFCGECGSSLFWQPADGDRINIAVGTLDRPTGLQIAGHWYAHQAGDYDALPDDGLPRDAELSNFEIPWR